MTGSSQFKAGGAAKLRDEEVDAIGVGVRTQPRVLLRLTGPCSADQSTSARVPESRCPARGATTSRGSAKDAVGDGGPLTPQVDGTGRAGHAVATRGGKGRLTITVRLTDSRG